MAGQSCDQVTFSVGGMGCGGCAAGLQAALLVTPGVREAQVDFASGLAKIRYDAGIVSPEHVGAAISAAGYEVTRHPA